jgi:hypothetical protein
MNIYSLECQERAISIHRSTVRDLTAMKLLSTPQFERELETSLRRGCEADPITSTGRRLSLR